MAAPKDKTSWGPDNPRRNPALAAAITHLVRDLLGCRCPDELIRNLNWWHYPLIETEPEIALRVDVAGRLLVDLFVPASTPPEEDSLRALLARGRKLRDSGGYHRYRLVMLVNEPDALRDQLVTSYPGLPEVDDRVHLHLLSPEALQPPL
jgi:hypothetical protein